MTQGGYGDQYRDEYQQGQSFPPPPPAPWSDPSQQGQQGPASGQQPASWPDQSHQGSPSGQQPAWPDQGQQGPASGQQPAWQDQGAASGQQPAWQEPTQQQNAPAWPDPGQQGHPQQQYGQQPYGQPGYQPYGQQGYDQNPWGAPPPGYGGRPNVALASWGARAGALILDGLITLVLYIPAIIPFVVAFSTADTSTNLDGTTTVENINGGLLALGGILGLLAFVVVLWNQGWRQGAQGWSWGKQIVGIKLVKEWTGQPPGGGVGIGRLFLRGLLGGVTFNVYTLLTYLWPLWDEKNQSLDDKMLSTLVVRAR